MEQSQQCFGTTKSGEKVTIFRLANSKGSYVELLDYGCTIRALAVPDKDGKLVDVVLGYDHLAQYQDEDGYLGAAVGRHANRIGKGIFTLGGKEYRLAVNNGANHLHGGICGFDCYRWEHRLFDDGITFSRFSPDGEEGYPGNLRVSVTYRLTEANALEITYEAVSDADTVVNLTNHSYFNLEGAGNILGHQLQLFARQYTENDSGCLPTGVILPVEGTPMEFETAKELGQDIATKWGQVQQFGGYDHNFVLAGTGLRPAAVLHAPGTGITMATSTTMPGVQLYTSNSLSPRRGKAGAWYDAHHGVCLETQFFPNAMACQNFPSPVLVAGVPYKHQTIYQFTVKP